MHFIMGSHNAMFISDLMLKVFGISVIKL